jgi:hypothetical protein
MKKLTIWLIAAALLSGCAESASDNDASLGKTQTPVTDPTTDEPAVEPGSLASASDSSLDAETLLASALEEATAGNKRVLVHLGAPW